MSQEEAMPVNAKDLKDLKDRMLHTAKADPKQFHNDFSLARYLTAFGSVDGAFQAILKTNKWREKYGVENLEGHFANLDLYKDKARCLRHRDSIGRPVLYIPAKNHNASERNIDEITKFVVKCLEEACKKCFEEVTDKLCIVFDLADTESMDMQLIRNLIWLLSRHYPERLGICLIINSPGLFPTIWPLIRQIIDDNTARKVVLVNDKEELCKYLVPAILPTDM